MWAHGNMHDTTSVGSARPSTNSLVIEVTRMKYLPLLFAFVIPCSHARASEPAKIVEVKKIWDRAPHNAFTDLVRFKDRWFCVFREGTAHVSPDGALRVITSQDGNAWV